MAAEPSTTVLKIRARLDSPAVVTRPGGTLVIVLTRMLTRDQLADIRQLLAAELPGVSVVVLDGVTAMTTYAPDQFAMAKLEPE